MPDYQKLHFALFNAVTTAVSLLQDAQRDAEETYIAQEGAFLSLLPGRTKKAPETGG